MASYIWIITGSGTSHYLKQWLLDVNWITNNKFLWQKWNSSQNITASIKKMDPKMSIVKWRPFSLSLNVLNRGCDLPTVHISLVHWLIQAQWYPPEPIQCVASLPTVHMSPVHLLIQVHWYSPNPFSVCQTYPLCICLQSIYWYRNNDAPWIYAVYGKPTHGAYVSGPSNDTDTVILLESTQCVSNLPTVHMSPVHLLIQAQWYSLNPLSV